MNKARDWFGSIAFLFTGVVIIVALSPWIPDTKEKLLYLILGSALTWPSYPLNFHYGSSAGSKEKTQQMAAQTNNTLPLDGFQEGNGNA